MAKTAAHSYHNPLQERFDQGFFRALPTRPGVYFFVDANRKPLYIGKADNLRTRLMSYRRLTPETAPDHTLEMIERARHIFWELQPSGLEALRREAELLRTIRPPFNIAGTDLLDYPRVLVSYPKPGPAKDGGANLDTVVFIYTYDATPEVHPARVYGCYQDRQLAKQGYSALLRLLYACAATGSRFHFPAKISRSFPPYSYTLKVPPGWRRPLHDFFSGHSCVLLTKISLHLLETGNIPVFLYHRVTEDLRSALAFYQSGPQTTRRIARVRGRIKWFVPQDDLATALHEETSSIIRKLMPE